MFRSEDIQARLKMQPFRPFRIIASEGLIYEIHHPDLVFVGSRDIAVGFPSRDNPTVYDQMIRLALVHIVGLEDIPPRETASQPTAKGA